MPARGAIEEEVLDIVLGALDFGLLAGHAGAAGLVDARPPG